MPGVGSRSLRHAFSLKKQAAGNIQTAVADVDINKQRGSADYAPFGLEHIATVSDAGFYGTGSNFGSFREVCNLANVINTQSRPASDLDLLFALGFVMGGAGGAASVQPNPVGLPATWAHTLTWADIGTSPEVDYTSFLEQMGDASNPGWKEKYIGCWLDQVTINGTFGDFVNMSFSGGARERIVSAAAMPATPSTASLMKIGLTEVSFGNAGSLLAANDAWASFELTFNQSPNRILRGGQPSGEETWIERVDRGDQLVTGNIVFDLNDTLFRQKFLAATEVGFTIKLQSNDTVDSVKKNILITVPHIQIAEGSHTEEERSATYTITLDETSVLKKSGDEPATVVVTTDIDNTEFFV